MNFPLQAGQQRHWRALRLHAGALDGSAGGRKGGSEGQSSPLPAVAGCCSARRPAVGRSVGRHRAGMNWCAMPSQVQGYTIPPSRVLLSLCAGAVEGVPFLAPWARSGRIGPQWGQKSRTYLTPSGRIGQALRNGCGGGINRPWVSYGFAPDHQARYDRVNACGHSLRWHVLRKWLLFPAGAISFFRVTFVELGAQHAMLPWRGS